MKTPALVNGASTLEQPVVQLRAIGRRRRVLPPMAEVQAIRASLTTALEAVWEAKATREKYGGG